MRQARSPWLTKKLLRAESTPEGQRITPLTKAEDVKLQKEYAGTVVYAEP